jgi:hypothetical protein
MADLNVENIKNSLGNLSMGSVVIQRRKSGCNERKRYNVVYFIHF